MPNTINEERCTPRFILDQNSENKDKISKV